MADELITLLSTEGRTVVDSHVGATPVSLEVVVGLPGATALGRDDDDPVSCTRAIEGCSTSVLDDGDILDVVGVDRREWAHPPLGVVEDRGAAVIDRYPVDDVEWIATSVDRAETTDTHRSDATGLTRVRVHCYPCDSPSELIFEGCGGHVLHVLRGDGRSRACEGGLAGVPIPRDDDVLDHLLFSLEGDLHLTRGDGQLELVVADTANRKVLSCIW